MDIARSNRRNPSSIKQIEFVARVGVSDAQIVGGFEIKGHWANEFPILRGESAGRLPEEFANCLGDLDQPGEILRFTRRYAPLKAEPVSSAEFRFKVAEWVDLKTQFCLCWETFGQKAAPKHWEHAVRTLPPAAAKIREIHAKNPSTAFDQHTSYFEKRTASWSGLKLENGYPLWLAEQPETEGNLLYPLQGRLIYGAANLWRFLMLALFSTPGERLRKCHNPDCASPYFVAHHLNQNFCSEPCARWGQRQQALAWWNKHGKEERQKLLKKERVGRREKNR
jgi:hypothetical protein